MLINLKQTMVVNALVFIYTDLKKQLFQWFPVRLYLFIFDVMDQLQYLKMINKQIIETRAIKIKEGLGNIILILYLKLMNKHNNILFFPVINLRHYLVIPNPF